MTKDEAVNQGFESLQSAIKSVLASCYDAGAQNPGTFTQADIDAAVAKATSDDQTHMQDLQSQIDLETKDVAQLKASAISAVQQVLAILGVSASPSNPPDGSSTANPQVTP